jgi:hypothetical protein
MMDKEAIETNDQKQAFLLATCISSTVVSAAMKQNTVKPNKKWGE